MRTAISQAVRCAPVRLCVQIPRSIARVMLHITLSDDPDSSDSGGGGREGAGGAGGGDVESSPMSGAGASMHTAPTPHAHPHAMLTHHLHLHPHAPSSGGSGSSSSARLVDVLPSSSSGLGLGLGLGLAADEESLPEHKLGTPERRHSFGGGGGGSGRGSGSASAAPLLGGSATRGGRRRSSSVGSGTLARSAAAAFAAGTGPRRNWLLRLSAWQHRHTHSLHACLLLCFLLLLLVKSLLMRTPAFSASLHGPPPASALSDIQLRRLMQSQFVREAPHWLGASNRPSTAVHISSRTLANFAALTSVPGALWPPALACPLDPLNSVPSQTTHCLLSNYFPELLRELPTLLTIHLVPEQVDCYKGRYIYVQRPAASGSGSAIQVTPPQSPAAMLQSYLSFMSFAATTETQIVSSAAGSPSTSAMAFAPPDSPTTPASPSGAHAASYWVWSESRKRSQWLWTPRFNDSYTRDPHVSRFSLGDFLGFEQWEASGLWLDRCAPESAVKRRAIRATAPIEGAARELEASPVMRSLWKALDSSVPASEFRLAPSSVPQPHAVPPHPVHNMTGLSVILPGYTTRHLFDARMLLVLEVRLWMRWTIMLLQYNHLRAAHEPELMPDRVGQQSADRSNAFLPPSLLEWGVDREMIADHATRNYKAGFALNAPADPVNPMHDQAAARGFQRFFSLYGPEAARRAPNWITPPEASLWPAAAQDPITYNTRPHWEPHDEWAEKHRESDASMHLNSFEGVFKSYLAPRIHVAIVIKQDRKMRVVARDDEEEREVTRGAGAFFRALQEFEHYAPSTMDAGAAASASSPSSSSPAAAAPIAPVDTRSSRMSVPLMYASSFLPPQSILDFVGTWSSSLPSGLRPLIVPTIYWDCVSCQEGDVEFLRVALARLGFEPRVKLNVPLAIQVQFVALSDVQMYFCDENGGASGGKDDGKVSEEDEGLQIGECGLASFLRSEPLKLFVDSPRLGKLYPQVRNVMRMEVQRSATPVAGQALAKEAVEASVVLPELDADDEEDPERPIAPRLKELYPALPAARLKVVSFAALHRAHKPRIRVMAPAASSSSSFSSPEQAGLAALISRMQRVWARKQRRLREGNLPDFAENYAQDYPTDWILKP